MYLCECVYAHMYLYVVCMKYLCKKRKKRNMVHTYIYINIKYLNCIKCNVSVIIGGKCLPAIRYKYIYVCMYTRTNLCIEFGGESENI